MTVFWKKYNELCDEHSVKPRAVAKELGISAATVTKWVNDGMPNLEMIHKIAKYFDVPIDYLINEDDTPIIPEANKKRSIFKSVSSLSQRWASLRRGSEISLETQLKIIPYVNCTVQFLNNDRYIQYDPEQEYNPDNLKATETIFDILGILFRSHCPELIPYNAIHIRIIILKQQPIPLFPWTSDSWPKFLLRHIGSPHFENIVALFVLSLTIVEIVLQSVSVFLKLMQIFFAPVRIAR